MKKLLMMTGLALSCGLAAHAAPKMMNTKMMPMPSTPAEVAPLKDALAANLDRLFVIHATMGNLNEVALGKMAMTHSKNPDVLAVAKMTMKEHGMAQMDLAAAARSQGYPLPADPGPVNKAFGEKLSTMRGAAFDKMYMAAQVGGHEQTIVLVEHEIEHGSNPRIKAYASNKLPGILGHASMIYTVAGKINAPGSSIRPAPVKKAAMGVAMQKMQAMKMGKM